MLAYMDWQRHQPKDHYEIETSDYKVVIDGIEAIFRQREDLQHHLNVKDGRIRSDG